MFVIKSNEMKTMDGYMIETLGISSLVLMENASKTVVDAVLTMFPIDVLKERKVVVLCGTGNNGGDGMVVARWLQHKGYHVSTYIIGKEENLSSEAKEQFILLKKLDELRRETTVYIQTEEGSLDKELLEAALIIDGIFGTGCNRTLSKEYIEVVQMVNKSSAYCLSIDVPTGINADNGKVMGVAIKADTTITFCLPKLGLLLNPGSDYVGKLIVSDIGIVEEALYTLDNPIQVIDVAYFEDMKKEGRFNRKQDSHKGSFGTVGIIAGDKNMLGATLLAAKAAYKTGAGLVKIFAEESSAAGIIAAIPECVVVPYDNESSKERFDKELETFALTCNVLLIGPGLSKSLKARHMVQKVLQLDAKVVLDADALNIVSEHMEWFEERLCEVIITPHIGEMARLTGYPGHGISENTLQFAEAFSEKYQVPLVLKSARTVIVSKKQKRYINLAGNSGLATAGSGDVLAGVIGSLYAQGYNSEDSMVVGVLLHSLAGDAYVRTNDEHSLIASDIINYLWRGL